MVGAVALFFAATAQIMLESSTLEMRKVDYLALAMLIAAGIAVTAMYWNCIGFDDTYITFRHSYNFATGRGLVYNLDERFLGSSAPGYALLLGILGLPWPTAIPIIANLIGCIAITCGGVALFELGRQNSSMLTGFVAGLAWISCPLVASVSSGEMPLQIALLLWSFVLVDKSKIRGAFALLVIACMVRPDALVAAPAVLFAVGIKTRKIPVREIVLSLMVLAGFFAVLWAYYGSPIPGSMTAKSFQREMHLWPDFWPDAQFKLKDRAVPLSGSRWAGPRASLPYWSIFGLMCLGLVQILAKKRFWLPALVWPAMLATGCAVINPPCYTWYLLPFLWPFVLLFANGVDLSISLIRKGFDGIFRGGKPDWTDSIVRVGILALLAPALGSQFWLEYVGSKPTRQIYAEISQWLNRVLPEGAVVYHFEIGYLGYYAPRLKVVDMLGLVHPDISQMVAKGNPRAAYDRYKPDVVLYQGPFDWLDFEQDPVFLSRFTRVASLPSVGGYEFTDVYMKKDLATSLNIPTVPSVRTSEMAKRILVDTKRPKPF